MRLSVRLLEALLAQLGPFYTRVRCWACDIEELRSPSGTEDWLGAMDGQAWRGFADLYDRFRAVSIGPDGVVELVRGAAEPEDGSLVGSLGLDFVASAIDHAEQSKRRLELDRLVVAACGGESVLLARLDAEPLRWRSELDAPLALVADALGVGRPYAPPKKDGRRGKKPAQGELAFASPAEGESKDVL